MFNSRSAVDAFNTIVLKASSFLFTIVPALYLKISNSEFSNEYLFIVSFIFFIGTIFFSGFTIDIVRAFILGNFNANLLSFVDRFMLFSSLLVFLFFLFGLEAYLFYFILLLIASVVFQVYSFYSSLVRVAGSIFDSFVFLLFSVLFVLLDLFLINCISSSLFDLVAINTFCLLLSVVSIFRTKFFKFLIIQAPESYSPYVFSFYRISNLSIFLLCLAILSFFDFFIVKVYSPVLFDKVVDYKFYSDRLFVPFYTVVAAWLTVQYQRRAGLNFQVFVNPFFVVLLFIIPFLLFLTVVYFFSYDFDFLLPFSYFIVFSIISSSFFLAFIPPLYEGLLYHYPPILLSSIMFVSTSCVCLFWFFAVPFMDFTLWLVSLSLAPLYVILSLLLLPRFLYGKLT